MPPEQSAKIAEFLKKVDQARRPRMDERVAAAIEEIRQQAELGPEAVQTLQAAAVRAEDAAQAEQLAHQIKEKTAEFAEGGPEILKRLEEPEMIQDTADGPEIVAYTGPLDQPVWQDALAHVLNPDQIAAWETLRAARTAEATKEVSAFVDGKIGAYQTMLEKQMLPRSESIVSGLKLPKERADAVNALAAKAVEASLDRWRQSAVRALVGQTPEQRREIVKNGSFMIPFQPENAPEKQAVWTQGLAQLLTDDERASVVNARGVQRARRAQALGRVMIALMDSKVAFTASERPKLEPLAERLVQTAKALFPAAEDDASVGYLTYQPAAFYRVAATAHAEDLRPVLDEVQTQHWLEPGREAAKDADEDGGMMFIMNNAPEPLPPLPEPGEPEDLEQAVADYLQTHAATHRKQAMTTMTLRAEDAGRTVGLDAVHLARLRTAAQGLAEADTTAWEANAEQVARSTVEEATRENIQQKLASIASYQLVNRNNSAEGLWKKTVDTELTPEQRTAWQSERDARDAYLEAAGAQFLTAEVDRLVALSPEQWDRLEPMIAKVSQDYGPDLHRLFASNGTPWFLLTYYMFLPLHAIPDEDYKAMLNETQWNQLAGSSPFSTSATYWDNVKQNHESRLQQEAKKKKP